MNHLKLSPNETVFYRYDPEEDRLQIRLHPDGGESEREPIAGLDHIALSRDPATGAVVGLDVESVQALLLQRLVRDLFLQMAPFFEAAPEQVQPLAATEQSPLPTESITPVAAPEPEPAPADSGPTTPLDQETPDAAAAIPAEPDRSPSEPPQPVSAAPVAPEEAAQAEPEAQRDSSGRRRGGRRRKEQEEGAMAAPPATHDETPAAPADTEAPRAALEASAPAAHSDTEAQNGAQEPTASAAPAGTEEEKSKPRRRRRRRRGKKKGEESRAAATPSSEQAPSPPADLTPVAEQEEQGGRSRREEPSTPQSAQEEEEPGDSSREPGRTAPIPGLGAPESFAFMGMHPHLGQVITALGYEQPTPIQRRSVPEIMAGHDVIGLSQTGSGKTMAFLIPSLHRLLGEEHGRHRPRVLVVAPTRELAVQVAEEAELLASHTDLRIATVYGGVSMSKQIRELKRGVDVVVATPGRLLDHIRRGNLRLDEVEVVVLDEADRMLDMGFIPDIRSILREVPRKRQTLLFSATMPPPIESLSMTFQQEPKLIEVARQAPPTAIDQRLYPVEKHLKTPLLLHLLEEDAGMERVLAFTETKAEADIVARKLREAGQKVAIMHGDRDQREREQALQQLRDNTVRILVATNVAARGLDIANITHIINYDVPQSVDSYVHRIGRTARGDAGGHAYTFFSLADAGMILRIESALERELPRVLAEGFDYDVPTPSWAKPSAAELTERLTQPKGLADRFKRMMRRR